MNDTEKRIKIAVICGWEQCLNGNKERYLVFGGANIKGIPAVGDEPLAENALDFVPNYFEDLNAMAEAERRFNLHLASIYEFSSKYHLTLVLEVGKDGEQTWCRAACATARQRANAFLHTFLGEDYDR